MTFSDNFTLGHMSSICSSDLYLYSDVGTAEVIVVTIVVVVIMIAIIKMSVKIADN
jgi:hypothetical protein